MATTAMMNAANGITTESTAPAAVAISQPAPAPPSQPAATALSAKTQHLWTRTTGLAKRFGSTWIFKYVALFVLVMVILIVIRPGFVMQKTSPTPENPIVDETYSWKYVIGISIATVIAAALVPLVYSHRTKIFNQLSSVGKRMKSAVLQ